MQTKEEIIRISARVPKSILNRLSKLYPGLNLSEIIRSIAEREIHRKKAMKQHLSLYGKFSIKDFDESLL